MIEHVLRIGAKLDFDSFSVRHRERLSSREVEDVKSRPIEAVPSHVAEGSIGGGGGGPRRVHILVGVVGWASTEPWVSAVEKRSILLVVGRLCCKMEESVAR